MQVRCPKPLHPGARIAVTAHNSGVVRSTPGGLPCPVLVDVDIGHRPPQFTLINGALPRVHWSAAQGGRTEQRFA